MEQSLIQEQINQLKLTSQRLWADLEWSAKQIEAMREEGKLKKQQYELNKILIEKLESL